MRNSFSSRYTTGFTEQFAMQLVNILKTNQSLEKLDITSNMLNNEGREKLLNSLKEENNSTLLELDTNYCIGLSKPVDLIQFKINTEIEPNRIWKRYNTNREKKEEEHGKKNISYFNYPLLLEALQNRPTYVFEFLQFEIDSFVAMRK